MIPDDLALLRTPGTPAVLPDGRHAVVSVVGPDLEADEYTGQLWLVDLDGSAAPRRLTRGHRDTSPEISPDGRWVAFVRAEPQGRPQVHVVEVDGGEPVALTDEPLGASNPRFSPDGTRIAYLARVPEDGRYVAGGDAGAEAPRHITTFQYRHDGLGFGTDRRQHVMVLDVPQDPATRSAVAPARTQLTLGDVDVDSHRWMPDGTALVAVSAVHAGRDEDLRVDAVVVDARTPGAPRQLTTAGAGSDLAVQTVVPAADGSRLWLLAQEMGPDGREFVAAQTGLFVLDVAAGQDGPTAVGAARRLTDAESVDLAPGVLVPAGDEVLVGELSRGAVELVAVRDDALRVLLGAPHVVQGVSLAPGAGRAVVTAAGPATSGDVLVVDLASGEVRDVTDLSAPLRATGRVRVPVELDATAPDGYPVHGWVVHPDPARYGSGPHPTILMIHGGPYAQYTHGLFDEVQVLAEAGYAVVYGNPRGSAGYGAAHGRAIIKGFGTVDTDDVLALLGAALEDPALDGARVGVMGGSYGGYLTAWLTTRTDRFAAAIVERGFLDPVSFVGSSDIGWFFGLSYLGDGGTPDEAAALAAQSPMAQVARVQTPTLVIHSEQDWRCPVEQGQRWFVELKRRGVEAELLLFPGEGHELTRSGRPIHRRARFEHVLTWWGRHLPV